MRSVLTPENVNVLCSARECLTSCEDKVIEVLRDLLKSSETMPRNLPPTEGELAALRLLRNIALHCQTAEADIDNALMDISSGDVVKRARFFLATDDGLAEVSEETFRRENPDVNPEN